MVTRFNNNTWEENCRWREKNNIPGCVYNSPVHIKEEIPLMITIYVIEMNNNTNKIMGIGVIKNKIRYNLKYKIHKNRYYNRYIYIKTNQILFLIQLLPIYFTPYFSGFRKNF